MAHPNEVLLRESFAALGRGDIDTVRSQYWAENIQWHIPGRSPWPLTTKARLKFSGSSAGSSSCRGARVQL
jgi:ketosteroid isomerase-like protein